MAAPMSPPRHEIILNRLSKEKSQISVPELIRTHPFNHGIDVIVPGAFLHHSAYFSKDDVSSYCVENLPLYKLITEEFIEAFVKKGRLYMLSSDTCVDQHDTFALIPGGILVLLLNKSSFGELGLSADKSAYTKRGNDKYVVEVDLAKPSFRPGKPNFERVKSCFERCPQLKANFLVSWVPHDDKICSSSIQVYFKSLGLSTSPCRLDLSESNDPCLTPVVSFSDPGGSESCDAFSLLDWLGAMSCGVDHPKEVEFANSMTCLEPNTETSACHVFRLRGFFPSEFVQHVLDELKEKLSTKPIPWFSFTVHGFHDSPVSWKSKEHGFHLHGDNTLTFIFFPDGNCWSYKILASHDTL